MSPSMPEQEVVQHFTHFHPLTVVAEYGEFTCDGCKTHGSGKTYRCACCDYNLHDRCATCPPTLLLCFMHPKHELQLVLKGPEYMCNICHGFVKGLYYRCEACGNFAVHPLCTGLPQHVSHVDHPAHPLELMSHSGGHNTCMVCCGAILQSWRYRCGPCGLDVHMECVNSSASAAKVIRNHPNHGCGHNDGHTNQGQGQVQRHAKRERTVDTLKAIGVGVACNIIASPISDIIKDLF